jgi:hypothetical protein
MKTNVVLPGEEKTKTSATMNVDFSKGKKAANQKSPKSVTKTAILPFKSVSKQTPRLKVFIWGESGTGKTPLALLFPKPAVIDMEKGTAPYADIYPDMQVFPTTNCDEVMAAVKQLAETKHDFKTLIIDPISVFWESLQKKWSDTFLKRNKGGAGYKFEYYDMQVNNWNTIKAEWKSFIRDLLALDINVVLIARSKTLYKDGATMKAIGTTFDAEKNLHYAFDTVVKMEINDKGESVGTCMRDRWRRLPQGKTFLCAKKGGDYKPGYKFFQEKIGGSTLEREAIQETLPEKKETSEQQEEAEAPPADTSPSENAKAKNRPNKKEKETKAEAPATKKQKETIIKYSGWIGMTGKDKKYLLAKHGVKTFDEITTNTANTIIAELKNILEEEEQCQQ